MSVHQQSSRQLQSADTAQSPDAVLDAAVSFFAHRGGVYSAFLEKRGPTHVVLRGQGGEEIVIGVAPIPGGTRVSGSTYMFDQQVARFLAVLPPYVAPPSPPALPEPAEQEPA
ncbi:MAG: hypothetical protein MUE41_09985 [Gemmatimonadaceae bacterium]|jgi:hypothetical protein|nr:hypothetical protein [Gemmatimonadaceae bacterium]